MNENLEIELKFLLKNDTEVSTTLDQIAIRVDEGYQQDDYYTPSHRNFVDDLENVVEWLRIRVMKDNNSINYKHWLPEHAVVKTHCVEYETRICDPEQLKHILDALNMKKLISVKKKRISWLFDGIEISIDSVQDLGVFIELESKEIEGDIDFIRNRLFECLAKIGAQTGEIDSKGYPYHLLKLEYHNKRRSV